MNPDWLQWWRGQPRQARVSPTPVCMASTLVCPWDGVWWLQRVKGGTRDELWTCPHPCSVLSPQGGQVGGEPQSRSSPGGSRCIPGGLGEAPLPLCRRWHRNLLHGNTASRGQDVACWDALPEGHWAPDGLQGASAEPLGIWRKGRDAQRQQQPVA